MASEKQSAMVLEIQPKSLLITERLLRNTSILYTDLRNLGYWLTLWGLMNLKKFSVVTAILSEDDIIAL